MALRLYNTLSQETELFVPLHDNVVRMYTCGPTVYNFAHIGNLRAFTFPDILRRWLRIRGYQLDHVMNITDVEDKIIRNSIAEHKSIEEYTSEYTQAFLEDSATLRLERPERLVKATEHVDDMAAAIEKLRDLGFTYVSDGSVYYRIANFPSYGKLSHNDFSGIRPGARVDVDEYDKADARDFVLWKAQKDGEPAWQTPLGPGRPGWHIECSVMAMKYLGATLDIHTGGVDLAFPHHENEIAQSEALTGKQFVRYWLHSEHLSVDGQKMSKSLGNVYTLRDLVGMGYTPEVIRYQLAAVPYRKKLNFTFDGLKAAATSIERLRNYKLRLETAKFGDGVNGKIEERTAAATTAFDEALDNDLNTAEALAAVFEFVRDTNTAIDAGEFCAGNAPATFEFLNRFDSVFDVLKPSSSTTGLSDAEVEAKIAERNAAKKAKDFKRADEIRHQLAEEGIILEDTKEGRALETLMKFESKAVHFAERKRGAGSVPSTTPIYTATSYVYDSMESLDRIFAGDEEGQSYGRYDNPTRNALADLVTELEGGAGAVACSSGMSALHLGILSALLDRPKRVVAANALYGSTTHLLMSVFGPMGVETTLADTCDLAAFEEAVAETKPGAVVIETISNPLLRVAAMDKIAGICARAEAPLIVDNTFATPMIVRPLELGANIVVHSATKYMAGHGDVLGGVVISDAANFPIIRRLSRTIGPTMSPFDSYLTMRGIKTMPLRVERQCANACKVASWLAAHPRVERVYFTGDPKHPDAATIARLFPKNLQGAMLAFDLKGAGRAEVFRFMEGLKMIVPATSLGDVHTMALYPAMSSHRDISAKMRHRLGIGDGLIRMSIGIEAVEDIIADLEQALLL